MKSAAFLFALAALSCSADMAQRRMCYSANEVEAMRRADRECAGMEWEACPAREQILRDLEAAHAGCP